MHFTPHRVRRGLAVLATAALIAGCQTPSTQPHAGPQLRLIEASLLDIPSDCTASGSFHVSFTVSASGRTRAIESPDAPVCIQAALTAWIESFRYAPASRDTTTAIEWMMVSAKRGS